MLLRRPPTFKGTSGQTSWRTDLGHAEKRGGWHLWRERERSAPIICTVKRELEVSPVRLSGERGESERRGREREERERERREGEERGGEIKVSEWRFLLREFGELVKRVILLNAAAAAAAATALPLNAASLDIDVVLSS